MTGRGPLRRAALALILAGLTVPITASARTSSPTHTQQLAKIEHVTESIRGERHTRPVTAKFLSDTGFNQVLTAQLKRDNPEREIDLSQHELVMLRELTPKQSLREILFGSMESQIYGVYDYKVHTLYVRTRGNKAFGIGRYVIAHEYTHALQDQHWGLSKILPDQTPLTYRNSDMVSARHALSEGDATNVQYLYISRQYSTQEIRALYQDAKQQPADTLPRAIDREFYFPYTDGYTFVKTLYARGSMRAVDAAYTRLPNSTYEIMHPQAYLNHWTAASVSLHGVKGLDGWKRTDDDVMGALGYKILIWQHSSEAAANTATAGYRGDRYIYLQNGGSDAMLLKSVWTSAKTAEAARSALAASIGATFTGGRWSHGGTVLTYSGGAVCLRRAGSGLSLAYAPTAALALQLGTAQTT